MTLPAPKRNYDRLRRLLVEAREKAGMTQVELADKLTRPQSFVSKIERGLRRVDVVEFVEIARVLKLNPVELLEEFTRDS